MENLLIFSKIFRFIDKLYAINFSIQGVSKVRVNRWDAILLEKITVQVFVK